MTQQKFLSRIGLLLLFNLTIVSCKDPQEQMSLEITAGFLPFVCVGACMVILICYKCCHQKNARSTQQVPTVTVIDIPEIPICPSCAGQSPDCPMAKDPIYLYSHPPPAYQPPPEYSTLVFDEIPTIQVSPVPVHAPSVDRPK